MAVSQHLRPTVLSATEMKQVPARPLGHLPGVVHRTLWRDGTATTGVLMIEGGHRLGSHTHRAHHHHMWVVAGEAVVLGKRLGPGSYAHIPAGVEHDIDATDSDGCTVYYTYLLPSPGPR